MRAGKPAIGLVLSLAAGWLVACSDDSSAGSGQKLVYVEQPGLGALGGRIVSVAADGSQRQVLWDMPNPHTDVFTASLYPSPSGRTILFADYTGGLDEWFTLPATGGARTLFVAPTNVITPQWSPDESMIAWLVTTSGVQLGVASPGSAAITILTPDSLYADEEQWSPDGTQIAFRAYNPDNNDDQHIYTILRTGGPMRPVTAGPNYGDSDPAWSPAGDLIAFIRRGYVGDSSGVWLAHPDGSQQRRLVAGEFTVHAGLFWSPDATEIMATAPGHGYTRIQVATGAQTIIGHLGQLNRASPWSPEGTHITYLGRTPPDINQNTGPSVVVATPSATQPLQVSPDSTYASGQVWLPKAR